MSKPFVVTPWFKAQQHRKAQQRKNKAVWSPGKYVRGFSTRASLNGAFAHALAAREEFESMHGPVRVIMHNGKLVP